VLGSGKSYQVEVYTGTGFGTLGLNFVDRDTVFDSSFTSVGGAGAGNGDFTGPSFYTIAIPPGAPTITGLFPGDSVITALYTAPASNGGLPITGYEATCNPGASTSARSPFLEATVPVINAQTYTCTVTAFNGAGTGTPSAPMVVEVPAVAVTNLRRASPNPTLPGSTVEYTVTFSYPVTGVDTTDFVLTTSGLTGASIVSVAGFGSLYMVAVNTGSGVGTLRLDMVDDDSIRDATAPLYGMGTGPGSFGEAYRIHAPPGAPTITSITPGVGSAGIVFDSPASDGGSAITGYQATCTPGPVTSAVLPASSIAIALTAGSYTCTVVAINVAGPGGPSNSMGVTVSPPSVTGITTVGPMPTAAATIDFDVTFSVLVTGVDTTDFALVTTGGVTGAFVASVTGSGAAYRVTVNTGTGSGIGSIRLDLADDDSITDGASPLGGAGAGNGSAQGPAFAIDRTAPTVQSLVIVGGTPAGAVGAGTVLTYEITFTRDVTGVDASDFSTTLTSSATATVGAVTGGGSVYRVTFTVGGSGTMRVNVADDDSIADTLGNKLGGTGAGNGAYLSGPTVTVDGTAPVVSSINHAGPASIIAGSIAGFTVRFSKPVTGVNAADFRLVATGAAAGTVSVVTGSGDTYTVTISTTAGVGTLRLDLADDDSIEDAVGLKLGGTGAGNGDFQGQAYDLAAPERAATGASPTGTGTIAVTFTGAGLGDTCTLSNSQLLPPPPGADPVPPTTPGPGVAFPHGLVAFTLTGCTPGATVTVTITYPEPITGLVYWTFGPTADDATPHWYTLPATVAGNTVSFTITDGGLGDADLTVNGTIVDPSGIGSLPPPIPTLSPPMLLALLSLFLALGLRRLIGVRR
jgi:hypothetical protein